jgi:hypothetical protein
MLVDGIPCKEEKKGGVMTNAGVGARPDGVTLTAVWFVINAVFAGIALVAMSIFALPAVINDTVGGDRYFAIAGVSFGMLFIGIFGVLDVAAAVGLFRVRNWGRWLAIVLAAMGLLMFPIGTVAGVLVIWYLLSDEGKRAFGFGERLPDPTKEMVGAA